jgi:hypothetical protein
VLFVFALRYTTRSNLEGLVYSFPEPEKVYRRRINRLAPRRLLESLGEEAISDIHLLFGHNNPTTVNTIATNPNLIMGDLLRPLCYLSSSGGTPHVLSCMQRCYLNIYTTRHLTL